MDKIEETTPNKPILSVLCSNRKPLLTYGSYFRERTSSDTKTFKILKIWKTWKILITFTSFDLGRWMLLMPVTRVDVCLFWFLRPDLSSDRLWSDKDSCCPVVQCCLTLKAPTFEVVTKRLTMVVLEVDTTVVLEVCSRWKCAPTAISTDVNIPGVPGCHLLSWIIPKESQRKLRVSHSLTT